MRPITCEGVWRSARRVCHRAGRKSCNVHRSVIPASRWISALIALILMTGLQPVPTIGEGRRRARAVPAPSASPAAARLRSDGPGFVRADRALKAQAVLCGPGHSFTRSGGNSTSPRPPSISAQRIPQTSFSPLAGQQHQLDRGGQRGIVVVDDGPIWSEPQRRREPGVALPLSELAQFEHGFRVAKVHCFGPIEYPDRHRPTRLDIYGALRLAIPSTTLITSRFSTRSIVSNRMRGSFQTRIIRSSSPAVPLQLPRVAFKILFCQVFERVNLYRPVRRTLGRLPNLPRFRSGRVQGPFIGRADGGANSLRSHVAADTVNNLSGADPNVQTGLSGVPNLEPRSRFQPGDSTNGQILFWHRSLSPVFGIGVTLGSEPPGNPAPPMQCLYVSSNHPVVHCDACK